MSEQVETATLLADYRQTLLQMHACRIEQGGSARRWNRLVNKMQSLHLALRQRPAGRAGISELISDEVLTVRQWAATHALAWDEPGALAELEHQAAVDSSLSEFEAKITMREHAAGRLNTTWTAKQPHQRRAWLWQPCQRLASQAAALIAHSRSRPVDAKSERGGSAADLGEIGVKSTYPARCDPKLASRARKARSRAAQSNLDGI